MEEGAHREEGVLQASCDPARAAGFAKRILAQRSPALGRMLSLDCIRLILRELHGGS